MNEEWRSVNVLRCTYVVRYLEPEVLEMNVLDRNVGISVACCHSLKSLG